LIYFDFLIETHQITIDALPRHADEPAVVKGKAKR